MPNNTNNKASASKPKASKNSDSKPNSKVTNKKKQTKIQNFGHNPLSIGALFSSLTTSSNQRELVSTITDYFDWQYTTTSPAEDAIQDYITSIDDSIFDSHSAIPNVGTVIRKATVYCLPQARNGEVAATSFIFQALVPTAKTGETFVDELKRKIGVVNTIVKPDFNIEWKRVATFNFLKLFKDSNVSPFTYEEQTGGLFQALFKFALVNPDDGTPFKNKVQFRIDIETATPIPISNSWKTGPISNGNWETIAQESSAVPENGFVTIELDSLQNIR